VLILSFPATVTISALPTHRRRQPARTWHRRQDFVTLSQRTGLAVSAISAAIVRAMQNVKTANKAKNAATAVYIWRRNSRPDVKLNERHKIYATV
jgi:hypothetical protein